MAALYINGISKSFGGIIALKNLDIEVEENSIVGILGPNGSGKTTLLNIITGIYTPDEGTIYLDDIPIHALSSEHVCRAGISRTFQNIRLFKNISVMHNVMVGAHTTHSRGIMDVLLRTKHFRTEEAMAIENALYWLDFVGLEDKKDLLPDKLTYAQQRLLEVARAMASNPKIVLLDEPAAGMNKVEIEHLMDLIRKLKASGRTVLLIEHVMSLVRGVTDKCYVLNYGERIAEGCYDDIATDAKVIEAYLGKGAVKK